VKTAKNVEAAVDASGDIGGPVETVGPYVKIKKKSVSDDWRDWRQGNAEQQRAFAEESRRIALEMEQERVDWLAANS